MTASIGIASYPADGDTVEEILKNADNAACKKTETLSLPGESR